jgi:hypothetical protein
MADDPRKKGTDGKLVSKQPHEVKYLEKKHGLPAPLIKNVIDQVGPSRAKVDSKLDQMKKNGRK